MTQPPQPPHDPGQNDAGLASANPAAGAGSASPWGRPTEPGSHSSASFWQQVAGTEQSQPGTSSLASSSLTQSSLGATPQGHASSSAWGQPSVTPTSPYPVQQPPGQQPVEQTSPDHATAAVMASAQSGWGTPGGSSAGAIPAPQAMASVSPAPLGAGPGGPGGGGPGGPGGGYPPGGPTPPGGGGSASLPGSTIKAPNLINGATTHGLFGQRKIRHPQELKLLAIAVVLTVVGYGFWVYFTVRAVRGLLNGDGWVVDTGSLALVAQLYMALGLAPILIWLARALLYGQLRTSAVRMSPTQFPQGYRMVVEAARHFGLRRVPDAYVQVGNGTINAFASGHGYRRFVLVTSDMFEIGGKVRDPEALRFVIAHEVGHLAAGHVSYFRLLFTNLIGQVPILGPAFSRSQEYTADNFGYDFCPQGAPGTMATLGAGKYLNADVNVNELADRAATENGFWVHVANWTSSHPVTTWRANALRDRSKPGKIWFRPRRPMYRGPMPSGRLYTKYWPTPEAALAVLDQADRIRPAGLDNQFGRFPGVDYSQEPTQRQVQTAVPLLAQRELPVTLAPPGQLPPPTGQNPGGQFPGGSQYSAGQQYQPGQQYPGAQPPSAPPRG